MKKYIFIMLIAFIAILNATYLSVKAYNILMGEQNPADVLSSICDINDRFSCTDALSSEYARPFGVPFPFIALAVYPILFLLALLGYTNRSYSYAKPLAVLSFLGTCFNSYIIYVETFYIGAFCPLCLLCSAIIVAIFITSLMIIQEGKNIPRNQPLPTT